MTEYCTISLSSSLSRLTAGFPHTVKFENISTCLLVWFDSFKLLFPSGRCSLWAPCPSPAQWCMVEAVIFNPTDTSCRRTNFLSYHHIPFQHSYDRRLSFIADVCPGSKKQIWNGDCREALRQQNAVFELQLMTFWDALLTGGQPELSALANANTSCQDIKAWSSNRHHHIPSEEWYLLQTLGCLAKISA